MTLIISKMNRKVPAASQGSSTNLDFSAFKMYTIKFITFQCHCLILDKEKRNNFVFFAHFILLFGVHFQECDNDLLLVISGYNAYVGMLWVDLTQNNPILRAFVHILNDLKNSKSLEHKDVEVADVQTKEKVPLKDGNDF